MEILIKKGFYTETTYYDNQAMCDQQISVVAFSYGMKVSNWGGERVFHQHIQPFRGLLKIFFWLADQLLRLLNRFSLVSATSSIFVTNSSPVQAYTTTFKPAIGRLPCRTKSKFYLANSEKKGAVSAALLEENYAERPCKQNAAQCAV